MMTRARYQGLLRLNHGRPAVWWAAPVDRGSSSLVIAFEGAEKSAELRGQTKTHYERLRKKTTGT